MHILMGVALVYEPNAKAWFISPWTERPSIRRWRLLAASFLFQLNRSPSSNGWCAAPWTLRYRKDWRSSTNLF